MSASFLPLAVWESGTTDNSIPANDNALKQEMLARNFNNATTAQPASPADGDCYIIQATHTGTQWAAFSPKDLAIYKGGTWYAFAPSEGLRVSVSGVSYVYTSGAWTAAGGGAPDRSAVSVLTPSSGVVNIDCSLGDYFTLAPTANVTSITFSNLPASGKAYSLMIRFTQDSTARTVAWPASFKWAGGAAGAVSTGSGAIDVLAITTFNQGTSWHATLAKAFA